MLGDIAEKEVKNMLKSLITVGLLMVSLTGCVVVPGGYHRGYYPYYGYRLGVVAPVPPVVVVWP